VPHIEYCIIVKSRKTETGWTCVKSGSMRGRYRRDRILMRIYLEHRKWKGSTRLRQTLGKCIIMTVA